MTQRTFTIAASEGEAEKVYQGFDKSFHPRPEYVALVQVEDTIEEFALDTPKARAVLESFLEDEDYYHGSKIIGCYVLCVYHRERKEV